MIPPERPPNFATPRPAAEPARPETDDRAKTDHPNPPSQPGPPTSVSEPISRSASSNAQAAKTMLGDLQREMNRLQREIRLAIQAQLGQITGRSLETIEENRELCRSIQEMLDAHGLRVRCNQCGNAAILRVSPRSGAAAGVFVFDHTINGRRTFHGGRVSIPEIRLVAKPARKPRRSTGGDPTKSPDTNRAAG
mgnify:CR=1 FL=1